MCELWLSQIHDSSSDSVTTDVLAAMNRVTLDIVGLAGEMPPNLSMLPRTVVTCLSGCLIGALTRMLCCFSPLQGLDTALTL